jgi:hypothetical protein
VADRRPFLLRMDPEVYAALQRWAADDLRSLNAQIEFVLRSALKEAGRLRADEGAGLLVPGGEPGSVPEPGSAADAVGPGGTEGGV